jgi:hypothetical protein
MFHWLDIRHLGPHSRMAVLPPSARASRYSSAVREAIFSTTAKVRSRLSEIFSLLASLPLRVALKTTPHCLEEFLGRHDAEPEAEPETVAAPESCDAVCHDYTTVYCEGELQDHIINVGIDDKPKLARGDIVGNSRYVVNKEARVEGDIALLAPCNGLVRPHNCLGWGFSHAFESPV